MSAEQDAGKSGKKLAALLGLGSIILFGGGYIAFSKLSGSNSDMQSAVNINSAASGGTRSVTETPHYRELLRADNERGPQLQPAIIRRSLPVFHRGLIFRTLRKSNNSLQQNRKTMLIAVLPAHHRRIEQPVKNVWSGCKS